ncbi:hypothetical protein CGGC5_v016907 [Colletotrichum fructicola Nara gc5]|uniref:Uncharacterized protein n=1 Tax=Colletotrichum fructicola (strain Nara gc5) TaxID=1213859 RepID=A0A7J6IDD1_COLFN|nr:hypothetical protein CGGC5_v016907 [Colletotrichum fructicola Nara gc5]
MPEGKYSSSSSSSATSSSPESSLLMSLSSSEDEQHDLATKRPAAYSLPLVAASANPFPQSPNRSSTRPALRLPAHPRNNNNALARTAPERSSLRDDPLILGRFYVQRDSVLYEDMIEWLLRDSAGPQSVCTSHRLTSDFDWPKFWEILCSDRVRYDPVHEVLNARLLFGNMTLWTGRIEHDGQWRIALDNMMAQCELYEIQRRFPEPSGQFDEEQENGVDQQLLVPGGTDLGNTIDQHLLGPAEQAQQSGHDIQPPLVPSDVRDLPDEPQQPEQAAKVIVADRLRSTDDDAQGQSEETEIVDEPLKSHQEMFISSQKPKTDRATETTPAPPSSRAKDDDVVFLKALQVEHMPDQGGVEDLFNSADNDTSWRKTCEFFGHDKKHVTTKAKHCRQLPGTKRALRPYQLDDVRRAVEQAVVDGHLGALLAHPMGVGKTITYQGLIAVRRLSFISLDHYMAHPEAHNNDSEKCALRGMPFGIQCACEKGGLTARLLQKFPRGATLVVSPSSVVGQTLKEAKAYFEPIVDLEIRSHDGNVVYDETFNFIRVVDWRLAKQGDDNQVNAAQAVCLPTFQAELPTKTRSSKMYKEWEQDGSNLLKAAGVTLQLSSKPTDGDDATGLLLIVGQQRVSRDTQWRNLWTQLITLPIRGGKEVTITIGGTYFFGLLVWDEAHQVRGLETNMAKVLWEILQRQLRPPMVLAATGSPITSGLVDLALIFSLLRNKPGIACRALLQLLKELDDKHAGLLKTVSQMTSDAVSQAFMPDFADANMFACIIRRASSSLFFGRPILQKKEVATKKVECRIDTQFRAPMDGLIAAVGSTVVKKLQDARATASDGPAGASQPNASAASRATSDIRIITKNKDVRLLELATHMPGFLRAADDTPGAPAVETKWDGIVKVIGRGKGTTMPSKYLDKSIMPPGIWENIDTILADCSRLRTLARICADAYNDAQAYPDDSENWAGFQGPKNVIIFAKWPILAYAVQLWFEKLDDARFQSAFIHSGLAGDERQKIVDWFSDFHEHQGGSGGSYSAKTHTKVLITTYALCGTGLDGLKVANYCVHFGITKNVNDVDQATGRIDRQGQPLKSFVYHLESMTEPLDQLTALMRDTRSALFGEGGLLGEVMRLFNQ